MTLKQLRELIALVGAGHNGKTVAIETTDGKRFNLTTELRLSNGEVVLTLGERTSAEA